MADSITVPDCSAAELLERAEKKLGLTLLHPEPWYWEFENDGRGKRYEVMWHDFGKICENLRLDPTLNGHDLIGLSYDQVRAYFQGKGFVGNAAAFIA